ncbi:uncharacterized protein VTP21DRAFT_10057 [Calcarisporiella thermophila]|uniref:uncharacterized protein n=1 Tax=Calcarisporiella thermophila TaxID=911321 RepID=UPI0037422F42
MKYTFIPLIAHLTLGVYAQYSIPQSPSTGGSTQPSGTGELLPLGVDTPPAKPEWLSAIDMTKVPNAPLQPDISQLRQCEKAKGFCNWSCEQCVNRTTDFDSCPKGQWAVTFDDGPTQFTPPLLDFLKQNNMKATFFVLGTQARDNPAILKRAFDEGHEIASHTWSHKALTSLTNEQIVSEMKWTELAIQQAIGVKPKYMRPPYGDIDDRVRALMVSMGLRVVIWNRDSFDWKLQTKQITLAEIDGNFTQWVQETPAADKGFISLEHDHSKDTVDIAIKHLPALSKVTKFVKLSECLNDPNIYQSVGSPSGSPSSGSAKTSSTARIPSVNGASSQTLTAGFVGTLMILTAALLY